MANKFLRDNLYILLFFLAGIMIMAVAIFSGFFVSTLTGYFKENIEQRLRFVSHSAAQLVTPEELLELKTPEDIEKPIFGEIRERIIAFGKKAEVKFVYYVWPLPDGGYQIIVDSDETENTENLASAPRPAADVEQEGFPTVLAGNTFVTDLGHYTSGPVDGGLLTSYAPIYDREGNIIAAAGIDIPDEQVLQTYYRSIVLSILMVISTALIIGIGVIYSFSNRKKQEAFLNRIRQQELMSQLSTSFVSAENASTLITVALRIAGEFLNTSRIVVGLSPDAGSDTRFIAYKWSCSDYTSSISENVYSDASFVNAFPVDKPPAIQAVFCNDVLLDSNYQTLDAIGIKAFIWVPLYVEKKYWAVLSIENATQRIWTQSDRQLVSMVGSVVAGAIERDMHDNERDAARRAAEQASQAKTDFLANMSHEMRTPMNAIIGMTSIAMNSKNPEKMEYCLAKIENASTHLLGVINDILDMSKIEANKFELSQAEFNFEHMLQKVVSVLSFKLEEKKQTLSVFFHKDIPNTFLGDDQHLAQVITNLLVNAVKFTPEGGIIKFDANIEQREGDRCTLKICVKDNGIGISKENQSRLFMLFEQADTSTSRQFGGTGLGLAISKRIVEMMGGSIHIESELGQGAAFIFTVQLQEAAGVLDSLDTPVDWPSIRALAVDGDPGVLDYFLDMAGRVGFSCDTAADGNQALEKVRQGGNYDICFIDWMMPDVDGVELAREIKQLGVKIAILMISTANWSSVENRARAAGVDNFLSKPLFPTIVADCICRHISSKDRPSELERNAGAIDRFPGKRLLLVEDVDINREIVISLLEPTELEIDCAENGVMAVKKFEQNPEAYDLIFMDIQMPEMDGYEATRQIRAFESEQRDKNAKVKFPSGVPIVAMSANVFREDVEKCFDAGMNGHVGKPLDFNEVIEKLRFVLTGAS